MAKLFEVLFALLVNILVEILSAEDSACYQDFPCACVVDESGSEIMDCAKRDLFSVPLFQFYEGHSFDQLLLRNNRISILDDDAFRGLDVTSLDISNNDIISIADNAFVSLKQSLHELDMTNCGQMWVPLALSTLHNLRTLNLSKNKIEHLDKKAMKGLTQLIRLDLSENPLTFQQSSYDSFLDLTNLQQLYLARCDLTTFPAEIVKKLSNLRRLVLNDNLFRSIPAEAFIGLHQLEEVNLEQNPIKFDPNVHPFSQLTSLRLLLLSHCNLTILMPEFLRGNSELRTLKINACGLVQLSLGSFRSLRHLSELDIGGNNRFQLNDPRLFDDVRATVTTIGLERMNLTSFPRQVLNGFTALRLIRAGHNNITTLAANDLAVITGTGGEVHLNDNRITHVSQTFIGRAKLPVSVDLRNNMIQSLQFIYDETNGRSDGTGAASLSCSLWRSSIDVTNNPIYCDCNAVKVVQLKIVKLIGTCAEPQKFTGTSLAPQFGLIAGDGYLERLAIKSNMCTDSRSNARVKQYYDCNCRSWRDVNSLHNQQQCYSSGDTSTLRPSSSLLLIIMSYSLLVLV